MFTFFGIGSSETLVAGSGSVSSLGTISSLPGLFLRDLFFILPIFFFWLKFKTKFKYTRANSVKCVL